MKIIPIEAPQDNKEQGTQYLYEDSISGVVLGIDQSPSLTLAVDNALADELFMVLTGQVTITDANTNISNVISAGEVAVIPQGLTYSWHQSVDFSKAFLKSNSIKPQSKPHSLIQLTDIYHCEHLTPITVEMSGDSFAMKTRQPVNKGKHIYQSPCGRFITGIWQSDALETKEQAFPRHECIFIQSGSLSCIDENHQEHHFTTGDALFIPKGTVCYWRIDEAVCTFYAVIQDVNE